MVVRISVTAHPNSRNPRINSDPTGILHVYVQVPPQDGRANKAIIAALAKYFGTKIGRVMLVQGKKSKNKAFEIDRP